jgi:hypothetical protein
LKARANGAKSGSVNFSRRLSRCTAIKKYRSERRGHRSFDTAIEYGTVAIIATEKTRTAKSAVRATCSFSLRSVEQTLDAFQNSGRLNLRGYRDVEERSERRAFLTAL